MSLVWNTSVILLICVISTAYSSVINADLITATCPGNITKSCSKRYVSQCKNLVCFVSGGPQPTCRVDPCHTSCWPGFYDADGNRLTHSDCGGFT